MMSQWSHSWSASPAGDLRQVAPDLVAVSPGVSVILDPGVVADQAPAGQGIQYYYTGYSIIILYRM